MSSQGTENVSFQVGVLFWWANMSLNEYEAHIFSNPSTLRRAACLRSPRSAQISVLDVASGRGGDQLKFVKALFAAAV